MDISITPARLRGKVTVPPSKSAAHRMIIAAALSDGESEISNLSPSVDISATMDCMRSLGAVIAFENGAARITGIFSDKTKLADKAALDCCESGSTLRFLIPVACALGADTEFSGRGKLPERPITPYLDEFPKHGITLSVAGNGRTLPCSVSGKLKAGRFEIDGGISSQFITGLMFALPLLDGDSEIVLTSPLQSVPYVDITLDVLKKFGIAVESTENGWFVRGAQKYKAYSGKVEGDYSQAAFFAVANALGSDIEICGLDENSVQGDKKIIEICRDFKESGGAAFELDCSDIPDLVPVLCVLGSLGAGTTRLTNVERLHIKECDRLVVTSDRIERIGGRAESGYDYIAVSGVKRLAGGDVDCSNDHRIAMSMAIAATVCESELILRGAECVRKSYPDFFEVYKSLGGIIREI